MTVLDPALHTALRALKLTGMLDSLDTRLAQARAGDLGHLPIPRTRDTPKSVCLHETRPNAFQADSSTP